MNETTLTTTNCPECRVAWSCEPDRPSLAGGCKTCRREYMRRYNGQEHVLRQRSANQRKHGEQRAREAAEKYHREGLRFAKYGITREDFRAMYVAQEGCCAICLGSVSEAKAHIDHDHQTGLVRGLLCSNCNRGLGFFADDEGRLERAITYLTKKEL